MWTRGAKEPLLDYGPEPPQEEAVLKYDTWECQNLPAIDTVHVISHGDAAARYR